MSVVVRWRRCLRAASVTAAACVALACCASAEAARVLYASADVADGDADADGSVAAPFSLPDAVANLQSGDTLYLSHGEYRVPGLSLNDLNDIVIATAPDEAFRARIRGDVPIAPSTWTPEADGVFATPVDEEPVGVVWNWDSNLTTVVAADIELGRISRHFGHLREAVTLAELIAMPGSWLWQDGVLRIHPPPAGANPTLGDTYSWLRPGVAMRPINCQRFTIRDIDFALWSELTNNAGYSVKFTNCTDSRVERSVSHDSGWHAYGAVGSPNRNNVIRECESRGQATNGVNVSNPFVFAHTVANAGSMGGFRGSSLTHHAYGLLDWNAQPLRPGYRGVSLISHGAAGSTITDVEWDSVGVVTYDEEPFCSLVSSDSANSAVITDPTSFGVRIDRASIRSANPGATGAVAITNSHIDATPARIFTIGGPSAMGARGKPVLYEACTFIFDVSHGVGSQLFLVRNGGQLVLENCSLYSIAAVENGGSGVISGSRGKFVSVADGSSSAEFRQSVFIRDTPSTFFQTVGGGGLIVDSCWYEGAPEELFASVDGSAVTYSMWSTTFDPNAVAGATGVDPFSTGSFEPPPGTPLREIAALLAPAPVQLGFNLQRYSGHYGAFQYGGPYCPADRTGDGVIDGADLGVVLGDWRSALRGSDFNSDAIVDGADLGLLLASWGPCPE